MVKWLDTWSLLWWGSSLIFNADYNHYFECPLCHYKYRDSKRKRAWIIKYRYKIFDTLEEYSKRYLLERNEKYLNFIEDALEYYSLNYDYFKIHNKEGKKCYKENKKYIKYYSFEEALRNILIIIPFF